MKYRDAFITGCADLEDILTEKRERELEARLLLESVCSTRLETLLAEPEREVSTSEEEEYRKLLQKRKERIPLAYLLGSTDFMGLPFIVNPSVLIPRQDTETLVELAMSQMTGGSRVLDLCTGSGCILLSLLRYSVDCTGVGIDLSGEALEIAEKNTRALGLTDSVQLYKGDLFGALPDGTEPFDMIVSNPPYIATPVIATLQPEVAIAEPRMALDGGQDGLSVIRRIAEGAEEYLTPGGSLYVEIGSDQGAAAADIFERHGYYQVEIHKDLGGLDRVVSAVRSFRRR